MKILWPLLWGFGLALLIHFDPMTILVAYQLAQ